MKSNTNHNTAATNAETTSDTGQGGTDSTSDTNNALPCANLPTKPLDPSDSCAVDEPSTDSHNDDLKLHELHSSDESGDVPKPLSRLSILLREEEQASGAHLTVNWSGPYCHPNRMAYRPRLAYWAYRIAVLLPGFDLEFGSGDAQQRFLAQ